MTCGKRPHRASSAATRPLRWVRRVPFQIVGFERRTASLVLAVVASIWLSSCGQTNDADSQADADNPEASGESGSGPFQWDRARTSDDDRLITIDFVGGAEYDSANFCTVRYDATATETDETVTVVVSGWSPPPPTPTSIPMGCAAMGSPRTVSVRLNEPLGERSLINSATGEAHPVNVEPWTPPTSTAPSVGVSAAP